MTSAWNCDGLMVTCLNFGLITTKKKRGWSCLLFSQHPQIFFRDNFVSPQLHALEQPRKKKQILWRYFFPSLMANDNFPSMKRLRNLLFSINFHCYVQISLVVYIDQLLRNTINNMFMSIDCISQAFSIQFT